LTEAAAEFNRYGSHKLSIDGPELGKLRVGGVFKISDPSSFALAMANAYHLRILNRGHTTVLTDKQGRLAVNKFPVVIPSTPAFTSLSIREPSRFSTN